MKPKFLQVDFRRIRPNNPPVLLLGGLNLIRTLGLASIPVIVATADSKSPALRSRYVCGRCITPSPWESEASTVEVLLEAGAAVFKETGCRTPLFYGSDDPLRLIYGSHEPLSRYYSFVINLPGCGPALLDKDRFDALMRTHDLPIPRRLSWDGRGGEALVNADFPVIVKPTKKTGWHRSPVYQRLFEKEGKARTFPSGKELLADASFAPYRDDLIVQEYVPGGDDHIFSIHGFADEESNVLAYFLGRKIRTYPKGTGESSFLELVEDEALTRLGKEIISKLGLKGVFKIDLKRHSEEYRFYLMEINARFTLWNYLGAINGVNLPLVAYEYLVNNRKTPSGRYETKYKWLDLQLDYKAFRELRDLGELGCARWLGSILFAKKIYPVFSWKDPEPFVWLCGRALLGRRHS